MPIRSRMSMIMGQIEPEVQGNLPLNLEKMLKMTVYTQSSTNINQSAPNLVKMHVIVRSWISSIMDLIGPELFELSVLELENLPYLTLFKLYNMQILTKLGHNIYAQKVSDEFDYRTNPSRTPGVICP